MKRDSPSSTTTNLCYHQTKAQNWQFLSDVETFLQLLVHERLSDCMNISIINLFTGVGWGLLLYLHVTTEMIEPYGATWWKIFLKVLFSSKPVFRPELLLTEWTGLQLETYQNTSENNYCWVEMSWETSIPTKLLSSIILLVEQGKLPSIRIATMSKESITFYCVDTAWIGNIATEIELNTNIF